MHVLIVGAGYAGLKVALRLSREDPLISVTLVNPSAHFRERIRDHQWASGVRSLPKSLVGLLRGTRVQLRVGRVTSVNRKTRWATVTSCAGDEVRLPWDYLVLAAGSVTDTTVPGVSDHAMILDGQGAEKIATRLAQLTRSGGKVVVVGAGTTGIETAAEIAEAFPALDVELVSRDAVGAPFSPKSRRVFARTFERLGVTTHCPVQVERVEPSQLHHSGGALPFDVCIWTAGFRATPPPEGLDLDVDARERVLVSAYLNTPGDSRVFVAGDGAAHPEARPPIPSGCKSALPSAQAVSANILAHFRAEPPRPFSFAPPLYCVSLGRKEGVVQRTARDGSLSGWVLAGRPGAWIKELICKGTLWAFTLERTFAVQHTSRTPRLLSPRAEGTLP